MQLRHVLMLFAGEKQLCYGGIHEAHQGKSRRVPACFMCLSRTMNAAVHRAYFLSCLTAAKVYFRQGRSESENSAYALVV